MRTIDFARCSHSSQGTGTRSLRFLAAGFVGWMALGCSDGQVGAVEPSVSETEVGASMALAKASVAECDRPRAEWIWCDDFDRDRMSRYFEYDSAGGAFKRTAADGMGGSYGMRTRFAAGQISAGSLKIAFGARPTSYFRPVDAGTARYTDVYWRVYVRNEAGWSGGGGNKLTRATSFATSSWAQSMVAHVWSGNAPYQDMLSLDPVSGTDVAGNLKTTKYNDFGNFRWLGVKRGATPLFASSEVGKWRCVEARVRLNDPNSANGVFQLWIDGLTETESTGLNWTGSYNQYGVNAVFLENYWNEGSPKTQQRYFDNFVVSTQPIGCGVGSSTPPAPVASVAITPAASSVGVRGTVQLTATLKDAGGNTLTGRPIAWSSSNSATASVSSSGLVTGAATGPVTITASSEGKSATATVQVSATAPAPVASVSIVPTLPTVSVGSTVQLVATAKDASGNTLSGRAFAWNSSNTATASVSSTGVVAGVASGSATITASSEGKSGTATVQVTIASPPPPTGGNKEPAGMTGITDRPFNTKAKTDTDRGDASCTGGSECWDGVEYRDAWSLITDPSSPGEGDLVAQQKYPAGFVGGSSPQGVGQKAWSPALGYRTLYHRFWVKLSENFYGHSTGTNKIFHIWAPSGNILFYSAQGTANGPLQFQMRLQGIPDAQRSYPANVGGQTGTITRGRWHLFEMVTTLNVPGQKNGSFKVWQDGVLTHDYSGREMLAAGTANPYWWQIQWSPTWGGGGGTVPQDMYMWLDQVYASGQR